MSEKTAADARPDENSRHSGRFPTLTSAEPRDNAAFARLRRDVLLQQVFKESLVLRIEIHALAREGCSHGVLPGANLGNLCVGQPGRRLLRAR
jgi:hypothetical protein